MLYQVISVVGATLILLAYYANQKHWTKPDDPLYNILNLAGAGLLGWIAVVDQRLGFILLEVVWAAVAVPPLLRAVVRNDRGTPHPS